MELFNAFSNVGPRTHDAKRQYHQSQQHHKIADAINSEVVFQSPLFNPRYTLHKLKLGVELKLHQKRQAKHKLNERGSHGVHPSGRIAFQDKKSSGGQEREDNKCGQNRVAEIQGSFSVAFVGLAEVPNKCKNAQGQDSCHSQVILEMAGLYLGTDLAYFSNRVCATVYDGIDTIPIKPRRTGG